MLGFPNLPSSFPAPPCASGSLQSQPGRWSGALRTGHASLPSAVSPSASLCDRGLVHPLMIHRIQPGAAWLLPKAKSPPAEKGRLSPGARAAAAKLPARSPGQHELEAGGTAGSVHRPGHAESLEWRSCLVTLPPPTPATVPVWNHSSGYHMLPGEGMWRHTPKKTAELTRCQQFALPLNPPLASVFLSVKWA